MFTTHKKILAIALTLLMAMVFSGCGSSTKADSAKTSGSSVQTSTASDPNGAAKELKSFTVEELKKYDGQNGNAAYVAVDGKVYDVTNNKKWKGGKHEGLTAGNDLTQELKKSPHGASVLKKLPVVGNLVSK